MLNIINYLNWFKNIIYKLNKMKIIKKYINKYIKLFFIKVISFIIIINVYIYYKVYSV